MHMTHTHEGIDTADKEAGGGGTEGGSVKPGLSAPDRVSLLQRANAHSGPSVPESDLGEE